MIDRERLRRAATTLVDELSRMTEHKIAATVPAMLPPTLRPLVMQMVGRLQIRSSISEAVTCVIDELTDDEWLSLLRWLASEAEAIKGDELPPEIQHASTWTEVAQIDRRLASPAIARVRRILGV